LSSDLKLILPQKKETLDLMFIMDCTGSMQSWINATKNELFNIIDTIRTEYPFIDIRVSFVGYRDFCDKNLP